MALSERAEMLMLTIGAFAKACRLSPKALRLYDELGLLRPAYVDPANGYRYYGVDQLEQARLVAWLRRLGMPLAEVREVCALNERAPSAAADAVRAYWDREEARTAARRDLADHLVGQLAPRGASEPRKDTSMMLELRYAAHSDTGRVRPANQDTAYADGRLLAVADGYGPAGAPASAAAVAALKPLRAEEIAAGDVLNLLEDAVGEAARAVRDTGEGGAGQEDAGQGDGGQGDTGQGDGGTTLTALLLTGSRLALVHIGDSRAYLLRDGGLFRITHDHSMVQSMIDEGRLTEAEATAHPRRALLLKALPGHAQAPDLRLHEARPGDRYLLCSDGLHSVVPDDRIRRLLSAGSSPDETVRTLVDAANDAGGPDNVSCVVADVVESA